MYLGDSIAEALIGPSPLAERDNYGYYAVVGKINGMRYFNHSVSGHMTSWYPSSSGGEKGGLLGMLYRDYDDGTMMKTHIEQADVIHISILGNNILQYNLGILAWEVAQPDFEDNFKEGEGNTLLDLLYRGSRKPFIDADGNYLLDDNGLRTYHSFDESDPANYRPSFYSDGSLNNSSRVAFDFPPTYQDIVDCVARIRQLNPDAAIVFQTVYNPYYDGSTLLRSSVVNALGKVTDDGRFGREGEKITEISQFRKVTDCLLSVLNNVIDKYIREYQPENFYKLDVKAAFDRVTQMDKDENGDVRLDGDCLGRQLIFNDWTHPSDFGHAIIACATQELFEKEELGVASQNALENYKQLRLEQLDRMYKDIEGVDADGIRAKIEEADSLESVTLAYFDGIRGFTPINYGGNVGK